MTLAIFLGALAAATPAAADAPAQPPAPAAEAGQAVISYPASFFAAAQANTARDMIGRLPGFVFDDGDSVRGFAGAAGNVLIDGARPTSKNDDLDSILRRVPASQVERIDVIRGGAAGIDMQGKTVVANVVRKTGSSVTGLIHIADNLVVNDGRHIPTLRLETTRRDGPRALEASLTVSGYIDDSDGDGRRVQRVPGGGPPTLVSHVNTEGNGQQIIATAAYETPLMGGSLRINGQLFHDRFTYDEIVDDHGPPGGSVEHDRQPKDQAEFGARYSRALTARASIEALFIQQLQEERYRSDFEEPGSAALFNEHHTNGESIARAVLTYRANGKLTFKTGGEFAYNWLDSDTRYAVNGVPVPLPAANVEVTEKRGEVFGQTTWRATSSLNVEAGMRFEFSTIASSGDVVLEKSLYFAKPRLAVTWSPNDRNQFRARIEREVSQLDFNDFVASQSLNTGAVRAGNPNLDPQEAWVYEAAYERRFWGSGAATVTIRHSDLTNVVDRAPIYDPSGAVYDAPGNIGEGTKDELMLNLTLPLSRFGVKNGLLRGQGTWRWSEVTDPATGRTREITKLKPLEWEGHFSQDLPRWKATWGLDAFSAWRQTYYRLTEIEDDKLRTWVVLYAEVRPRRDLSLRAEIDNLFSRGYERILQEYAGPRGSNPLVSTDTRELKFGPEIYLRVRKTFG